MILQFGVFASKLSEQLKETGISIESLKDFDKLNDSIERLRMNGYLANGLIDQMRRKLIRRIVEAEQRARQVKGSPATVRAKKPRTTSSKCQAVKNK